MIGEYTLGGVTILKLAERPLVDDVAISGDVKETGGDPWLQGNKI